jgi:hypothetical protein
MAQIDPWQREACLIIKTAMKRKGITHKELARDLKRKGIELEEQSLINKLNRGTFPFAFALMVMSMLGVHSIEVPKL